MHVRRAPRAVRRRPRKPGLRHPIFDQEVAIPETRVEPVDLTMARVPRRPSREAERARVWREHREGLRRAREAREPRRTRDAFKRTTVFADEGDKRPERLGHFEVDDDVPLMPTFSPIVTASVNSIPCVEQNSCPQAGAFHLIACLVPVPEAETCVANGQIQLTSSALQRVNRQELRLSHAVVVAGLKRLRTTPLLSACPTSRL